MEIAVLDVGNTVVHVESTGLGIETPWLQYTSHEYNKNEEKYNETSKTADKYIPE